MHYWACLRQLFRKLQYIYIFVNLIGGGGGGGLSELRYRHITLLHIMFESSLMAGDDGNTILNGTKIAPLDKLLFMNMLNYS